MHAYPTFGVLVHALTQTWYRVQVPPEQFYTRQLRHDKALPLCQEIIAERSRRMVVPSVMPRVIAIPSAGSRVFRPGSPVAPEPAPRVRADAMEVQMAPVESDDDTGAEAGAAADGATAAAAGGGHRGGGGGQPATAGPPVTINGARPGNLATLVPPSAAVTALHNRKPTSAAPTGAGAGGQGARTVGAITRSTSRRGDTEDSSDDF